MKIPISARWRPVAADGSSGRSARTGHRDQQALRGAAQTVLAMVLAIIGWQSIQVTESFARAWSSPLWIIPHVAWPASFILCGYVLARVADVEGKRRVLPRLLAWAMLPLLFTILGTAFLLGPAVTTTSLSNYFADVDLWNYLLNLVAWPHSALPGVFEFNNVAGVANEPMWAVPCLVLTVLVALVGGHLGSRTVIAFAAACGLIIVGLLSRLGEINIEDRTAASALAAALAGQLGILAYQFRNHLRVGRLPIALSGAGLIVLAYLGRGGRLTDPASLQLAAILSLGPVLAVAIRRLPLERLTGVANPYLGGALLVAFPIQQLIVSSRSLPQGAAGNFLLALPAVAIASIAMLELSKALVRMAHSVAVEDLPALDLKWWEAPSISVRGRRRALSPLVLLYSALVVGALGALAMTLFALQHKPWEN